MVAVQHLMPQLPAPLQVVDDSMFRQDSFGHEPTVFSKRVQRHIKRQQEHARLDAPTDQVWRVDAVDTIIASRDLEQVLAGAIRDDFGVRFSTRLLTVETGGIQAWADRFIQKRITRVGLLDYVNSADMPWINVAMQEIPREIRTLGARFGWSWFELQQVQLAQVPLRTEYANAFGEAAEDTKDMIFLRGDAQLPKGLGLIPTGLINDPNVTIMAIPTGDWPTATSDEIIADLAAIATAFNLQTRRRERADTLVMSEEYAGTLLRQVPNTNSTILAWINATYPGLRIEVLPELSTASATGGQRMLYYPNNPSVVRGILPLDASFIADETFALRTDVYGVLRIVGVEVRKPYAVIYIDG